MQPAVSEIITAIVYILQVVPVGTNLGLCRILWALVQGSLLISRGALHGGLEASGFAAQEIRQSWSALRHGSWEINELLTYWQAYVVSRNEWQASKYGNYRVKSVDITGFWRPRLQGQVSKHYHAVAQKALPAMVFGIMISAGQVQGKRVPLLQAVVRCPVDKSEKEFRHLLLEAAVKQAAVDEVTVVDAGFEVAELHRAKVKRYVVRLAHNCTARWNQLPTAKGKGRHSAYGEKIRPLPRTYGERTVAATPAQVQGAFQRQKRTIRYESWHTVVTSQSKVSPDNPTYTIHVFYDPHYTQPLVLATDLPLAPELIYLIYRDRWPVEQPPLVTKQLLGLQRQFVFAQETCFRLPEVGLLAGNLLTHSAALLPPAPSGFWDRTPKSTPGRLRRVLHRALFPNLTDFDPQMRKKNSIFHHLPFGILAHRRKKAVSEPLLTRN